VDANGQVTLAGTGGIGLPTTAGVIQATVPASSVSNGSNVAGYVLQMNASATSLNYATYVPGTDYVAGLAVAPSGNIYLAGYTSESNLPVSADAYLKTIPVGTTCACKTGFILQLDGQGKNVLAASYLGGTPIPQQFGTFLSSIALDSHSDVLVAGNTASADFPLKNPFVSTLQFANYAESLIVAQLSPDLSSLTFSSFLSSTSGTFPGTIFTAMTVDSQDNVIVAGTSSSQVFPTTANSFQPVAPAEPSSNAFFSRSVLSKLNLATPAPSVCFAAWSFSFGMVPANTSVTQPLTLTNCGNATLHLASLISSNPSFAASQSCGAIAPGTGCPIQLTFSPPNSSLASATITINDDAVIAPQAITVAGQGVGPTLTPQFSSVSFGSLLVGTTGAVFPLIVNNTGNAALKITTLSNSGDFTITQTSCTSATVQPQKFCAVLMTFSPVAMGNRAGALVINSNDPQNPQMSIGLSGTGLAAYSTPTITALGSPVAPTGTAAVTLQITGSNFFPASVVLINGAPQQTTFSSNSSLSATVSPALLGNIGELPVTVFNPSPGGGESTPVTLTLYRLLPVDPSFLVYVPTTGLLYASIYASAATNPNTVIPVAPTTGNISSPISVCNDPRRLAGSDDGKYLYVSCIGDKTIQRINLQTSAVERTFPFPVNQTEVADMHAVPGSSQLLVAAFDEVVGLYNDAGLVNIVPGSNQTLGLTSFAFVGPSNIYALPFTSVQNPFFTLLSVNAQGLQYTAPIGTNFGQNLQTGPLVVSDGTLLYTNAGEVWNPGTQSMLGTFPVSTYNATSYPNMRNTLVDSTLGQVYVIGGQNYGQSSSATVLSAYGIQSLALTGTLAFPQVYSPDVENLVRWGTNGFAFIAPAPNIGDQEVYILRSSVAAPQAANTVPVLSSISPSGVASGGPSFTLALSGSGFAPNAVVYWNATARETSTVSNSLVMASIPASDISAPGSAQVTVVNPQPGGGASSPLTIAIQGSGHASLSIASLNFAAIVVGTSSGAQTVTVTNSGSTALSFSSISIAGDFAQTSTCTTLVEDAACTISVIFTPTASGSRTGIIMIADSDPSGPQTVSLSGTGMDIQIAGGGSGTSTTVSAGQPASYTLSISPMGGFTGQVTFSCSNLPANAACNINPSAVALSNSPVTVAVTISTSQQAMFVGCRDYRFPWATWRFALLILFCLWCVWAWSSRLNLPAFALVVIFVGVGLIGCGGGASSSGGSNNVPAASVTPAGTYAVNFTATASGISRTIQLTLVVQ
jgi:hypothetical protein